MMNQWVVLGVVFMVVCMGVLYWMYLQERNRADEAEESRKLLRDSLDLASKMAEHRRQTIKEQNFLLQEARGHIADWKRKAEWVPDGRARQLISEALQDHRRDILHFQLMPKMTWKEYTMERDIPPIQIIDLQVKIIHLAIPAAYNPMDRHHIEGKVAVCPWNDVVVGVWFDNPEVREVATSCLNGWDTADSYPDALHTEVQRRMHPSFGRGWGHSVGGTD